MRSHYLLSLTVYARLSMNLNNSDTLQTMIPLSMALRPNVTHRNKISTLSSKPSASLNEKKFKTALRHIKIKTVEFFMLNGWDFGEFCDITIPPVARWVLSNSTIFISIKISLLPCAVFDRN